MVSGTAAALIAPKLQVDAPRSIVGSTLHTDHPNQQPATIPAATTAAA